MISIKDITLGQFAPRESFVHSLDPRTKIILCFLLITSVLFIQNILVMLAGGGLVLLIYSLAKINPGIALKNFRPFLWLFLFTFLLHCFFTPGTPLIRLPFFGLEISETGVFFGIFYSFRIVVFIVIANLLTLCTPPLELTDAIEALLKPFKRIGVPAHEIAMMMSIALRFIPILLDEADRIYKAQISRGAIIEGNIFQKLKGTIPIILPLFLSAFRKANELALAMDSRCYRGGVGRTSFHILRFGKNDGIAFGITALACCMILIQRYVFPIQFLNI